MNTIFEIIGWLKIVASPVLGGCLVGLVVYLSFPTTWAIVVAAVLILAGLFLGIIMANKIYKTQGTMNFLATPMRNPELDNKD
jgi:hypothetical protein